MNRERMQQFLNELEGKGYSKESLRAYRTRVGKFVDFMDASAGLPNSATIPMLINAHVDLLRLSLDNRSINNHISSIEHFIAFCGVRVKAARMARRGHGNEQADVVLTQAQWINLHQVIANYSSVRDKSILLLSLLHGFRLRELRNMKVADVLDTGTEILISVPTDRGRRIEYVRLDDEAGQALRAWIKARGRAVTGVLFCTRDFRQMSVDSFDHVIRSCGWRANLVLNSRVLRYSCTRPWEAAVIVAS